MTTIDPAALEAAKRIDSEWERFHAPLDWDGPVKVARALLDAEGLIDLCNSLEAERSKEKARAEKAEAERNDWRTIAVERAKACMDTRAELAVLRQAVRDAEGAIIDKDESVRPGRRVWPAEMLDILRTKVGPHMGTREEHFPGCKFYESEDNEHTVECRANTDALLHEFADEFKPKVPVKWTPPGYRGEWNCIHADGSQGPGHGNHIHGCDGCCSHESYPGRSK